MPTINRPDWDIFCTVVDNFGDIGVCWRLARQLASEHGMAVRLWVDDLRAFQPLCPQIDPQQARQRLLGVDIRRWETPFPEAIPARTVVEAFACRIPDEFVAAMAQCEPRPVWINLEYLSAENWVAGCHALPSPHPRLPLTKYFFFPGFTPDTGGLLREKDLLARRQAFDASPELQAGFWRELGFAAPNADALTISLFAYENPAILSLLQGCATARGQTCCLLPVSRALPEVEAFCGQALRPGDTIHRGALEIRIVPFVEQSRYDPLLWACDLNFVRGEDSFVRAQWAARPMVWHIYPQQDDAHLVKLDAFLDLYCAGLPAGMADELRKLWHAWNAGAKPTEAAAVSWRALWDEFLVNLPLLRTHSRRWAEQLAGQEDLSSALVRFCRSKL
ncbi:MAG: elongation factor P maturation arginine rhamnosyltransferase EarP [Rhodocyclaceae bacterium]